MDADDEKIIKEQPTLLGNNQEILKHTLENQLGILGIKL